MTISKIQKTNRYINGVNSLNKVSPGIEENMMNSIEGIAPFFKQFVVESFGDFFSREENLSLQQRELAVVASLATLGHSQAQLSFHVQAALTVGCSESEIAEVISTVALYAGVPAALNGLRTAAEVFETNDKVKES